MDIDTYSPGKKGKLTKLKSAKTKKGRKAMILTPGNTPKQPKDFRSFLNNISQKGYTHVYLDISYLLNLVKKYNNAVSENEFYQQKIKSRTILRKKNEQT